MVKIIVLSFFLLSCATHPKKTDDSFAWLESLDSQKSSAWVLQHNTETENSLAKSERFKKIQDEILKILNEQKKIRFARFRGGFAYNFLQDATYPRGVWRRATEKEYRKPEPKWEVLIDFLELSKKENQIWNFDQAKCLFPDFKRCLISLSHSGEDATTVREFDVDTKSFVNEGFDMPAAKNQVEWVDRSTVLVSTDFGPQTMTESGYPAEVRLLKRGQKLAEAKTLITVGKKDLRSSMYPVWIKNKYYFVLEKHRTFFDHDYFLLEAETGKIEPIPLPSDAELLDAPQGRGLVRLKKQYLNFKAGSLIAFDLFESLGKEKPQKLQSLFEPSDLMSLQDIQTSDDYVYALITENLRFRVRTFRIGKLKDFLVVREKQFEKGETVDLMPLSTDPRDQRIWISSKGFLKPDRLDQLHPNLTTTLIKKNPSEFSEAHFEVEMRTALSKDGTHIPYELVRGKSAKGSRPTLLTGYGGFGSAMWPQYDAVLGKVWLERGGSYVLAHLRGGSEFGPQWHEAAQRENKQKTYDDFIAVAEDLIAQNLTTPHQLAIRGYSNGGLLTAAAMTQRPELFGASLVLFPLTDMLRYNLFLAGASWMDEYGDPQKTNYIYSPYHHLKSDVQYPPTYLASSLHDDRVHPLHARKFAARLEELKSKFYYHEETEGGHGGHMLLKDKAANEALEYEFLFQTLDFAH